jgi:hypothetical protein
MPLGVSGAVSPRAATTTIERTGPVALGWGVAMAVVAEDGDPEPEAVEDPVGLGAGASTLQPTTSRSAPRTTAPAAAAMRATGRAFDRSSLA